jgi:hypothetical protein
MTFCPTCGGADFCQPTCTRSTGLMQYYQRSIWYLRIMATQATSADRRSYWTRELAQAQAQLAAATPALAKAA